MQETADEEPDRSLVDFARKLAGISPTAPVAGFKFTELAPDSAMSAPAPESANEDSTIPKTLYENRDTPTAESRGSDASQLVEPKTSGKKQLKTPDEIAKIISDLLIAAQTVDLSSRFMDRIHGMPC